MKQNLSLPHHSQSDRTGGPAPKRNMTRKEIDDLIRISEGQVQYALRNLRQILEHGEARGQEVRWTKLLIGHKDLIEVLKQLKADDE